MTAGVARLSQSGPIIRRPPSAPSARPVIRRLLLAAPLCLAPAAHAARPMVTDDARMTEARSCQLETWLHAHHGERELWALPACNPTGDFEITAGGAFARADGEMLGGAAVLQAKTLFRPLSTNDYGVGLAVGYATQPGQRDSGSPYFYVPASLSLADDRVVLHLNLGTLHERETRKNRLTWGLGSEIQATGRLYAIAETYGQDRGSPFVQIGLRYWIVPERVQVDTTWGSRAGHLHDEQWLSIGLRLLGPAWF